MEVVGILGGHPFDGRDTLVVEVLSQSVTKLVVEVYAPPMNPDVQFPIMKHSHQDR